MATKKSKPPVNPDAPPVTKIIFPLYPDFDILDVSGPFALLSSGSDFTGLQPVLAAEKKGTVTCLQGIPFQVDLKLSDVHEADIIWVPGGYGDGFNAQISNDSAVVKWLKKVGPGADYVCSVCTGALILGASGLLNGYTATTHWSFQQELAMFPGVRLASGFPRYWMDRNRLTGGGISSGLDEALALLAVTCGSDAAMHAQLMNQYAPDPPYHAGTPDTAPPDFLGYFFNKSGDIITPVRNQVLKFLKGK